MHTYFSLHVPFVTFQLKYLSYTQDLVHTKSVLNIFVYCFSETFMLMRSIACHWTSGFHTELSISMYSSPAHYKTHKMSMADKRVRLI